jgi:hypothetical protein
MQYSSNSNAAIVGEIRSACTPVGQYRRAALIVADKEHTLKVYAIERQKQELEIERLGLLAQDYRNSLEVLRKEGGSPHRNAEIAAEKLDLDIALLQLQMDQSATLVEDARGNCGWQKPQ